MTVPSRRAPRAASGENERAFAYLPRHRALYLLCSRMSSAAPPVVPELDVADLDRSLRFYVEILEFDCRFQRPEERFAYLTRGPVHLMLEQADGPGRRFRTAPLDYPFGRGINLQIEVPDVDALYARTVEAGAVVHVRLEERWYRQGDEEAGNRQFVVVDPDGYLLRFFSALGRRPADGTLR